MPEMGTPARAVLAPAVRQLRLPKMAELVADHLRRQIVRGELAEGEALPSESELMRQFEISRPTLREAFRILETESLITVRRGPGGGVRMRPPNLDVASRYAGLILQHQGITLADVLAARAVIEPRAVRQLAASHTDDDVARLRAHIEEPWPGDPAVAPLPTLRRLERFHTLLVELVGNQTLLVLMRMLEHIVEQADRSRVEADTGSPELASAVKKSRAAHAKVVDLIETGDMAGAERLWHRHLSGANEYLLRSATTIVVDMFT
ncbi:FadR/GntR family transcriptional regulator [Parafrankia sp. FMc2]|uniref:FadR/GntR family transcriptional regulator n=1 Tax=Parafrankia sp. FMc2 TaxID=3233196 RepID=UPI0034D4255A